MGVALILLLYYLASSDSKHSNETKTWFQALIKANQNQLLRYIKWTASHRKRA